jgi:predicted transcriptional regulator
VDGKRTVTNRPETFADVLNDYLVREGLTEREFARRTGLHPTSCAELRCGLDSCDSLVLKKMLTTLRLRREWAARFYVALLAERDGEELLRAAGLVEVVSEYRRVATKATRTFAGYDIP